MKSQRKPISQKGLADKTKSLQDPNKYNVYLKQSQIFNLSMKFHNRRLVQSFSGYLKFQFSVNYCNSL